MGRSARSGAALEPLQLCFAGACLAGHLLGQPPHVRLARRGGALDATRLLFGAGDVLAYPADQRLLVLIAAVLPRQLGGALLGVGRVVADVTRDAAPPRIHCQDLGSDPVEEGTVVRHEQHAAGECQQGLFQESQRGVVEVVGRFVQDQEVGALGELPAQPQLEPLPAAEPAYRRLRVELGHAPAAQRLGLPPVRRGGQPLQGRAVGGRCFRVVRSRRQPRGGRRHLLLQAGGSAEELAHRARCTAVAALVEVADGEIGRGPTDAAGALRMPPLDRLQQGGLAAAVGTDQGRAAAGWNREGDFPEQVLGTTRNGEIGYGKHGSSANQRTRSAYL